VDGPALVDLLAAGDPRGLAVVYDAYADRLFAYCVSLLGDRDAAADAVHDTLLIARERAGQLRDPERLRPWLYAIARNECLRALRDRRRTAGLDEAVEVSDDSADLDAALRADELRELVWSAAAALNPGEREVLELAVRHGLEGADLGDALGVSANHASALLSRARTQLERALAALIVARAGRDDCPELDGLLGDWDGRLTPLLRKRVARHLDRCAVCGEQRRLRVSATALLAGVPFLAAPFALRQRVLRDAGDLRLVADWEALAARAGPYRPDGFPRPLPGHRRRALGWWSGAAAVAAVVLLMLGLFVLPGPTPTPVAGQALPPTSGAPGAAESPTGAATPTPTPTPTPAVLMTTSRPRATAAPAPTTPAIGTPPPGTTVPTTPAPVTTTSAAPTTPAPPTTPPRPPPPTPTVTTRSASVAAQCRMQTWTAQLYAGITGAQASKVTAHWFVDPAKPTQVPMTPVQGTLWSAQAPGLPTNTPIGWYVSVITVDGVPANSDLAKLRHDCLTG
jgi:RNA polymerase sigma factor (sigma-70 family)